MYAIKGNINGETCYFNNIEKQEMFGSEFNVRIMSGTSKGAKLFETEDDAILEMKEHNLTGFDIVQICPKCKKEFVPFKGSDICEECRLKNTLKETFKIIEDK